MSDPHKRRCWKCKHEQECEDSFVPHVLCENCGSQDTRRIKPKREPLFLLLFPDAGHIGRSPLFWKKGDHGYTQWIDDARQFTKTEADAMIRGTKSTHNFQSVPVELAERIARRTIDIDDLRKAVEAGE